MKKILILILLTFTALQGYAAIDKFPIQIIIHNNKTYAVYYYKTFNNSLSLNDKLVLFLPNKDCFLKTPEYRINAFSQAYIYLENKEENKIKNGSKINVFIISEKTMKENSWEDICKNKMYEIKVIFNKNSINKPFIYK